MAPSISARQRSVSGMPRNGGLNSTTPVVTASNARNGPTGGGNNNPGSVAVVGGGLVSGTYLLCVTHLQILINLIRNVGSMVSCFLARRGYQVDMYEMRDDPRTQAHVQGKSINLALSERGRSALRVLGLENEILEKYSIKMYARMIHDVHGNTRAIPYGRKDQCILSVSRRFLNELLITEAEKSPNVTCHFNHKMTNADLEHGVVSFQNTAVKVKGEAGDSDEPVSQPENVQAQADVIIGCDGAYSAVRRSMTKMLLLDYSQKYIEHGYLELCIPPTATGDYAMEPNYLHIWPRGSFMMIALPNLDKSFTVTLFMPFKLYDEINNEAKLLRFFGDNFPDSIPLLTKEGLCKAYFGAKPSALISIKCKPYNYKDKVLLMGDAAHAMVPFYGQGMNCGFEDCVVLEELLNRYGNDSLPSVLDKFTAERVANCHTIIDLAMYNYVEMRDLVNKKSFLLRKKFDNWMYSLFPSLWIPLYTMVTFTRIPYKRAMDDRHWQDEVIKTTGKLFLIILGLLTFVALSKQFESPTLNPSTM